MKKILLLFSAALMAFSATGQTYDDHGCITAPPAGKTTTYIRSGYNRVQMGFDYSSVPQQGTLDLVECEDGTVYMQQPISSARSKSTAGHWIKGVRNGRMLTFKSQVTGYVTGLNVELRASMGTLYGTDYIADFNEDIVFEETTDGKKLMLLNTDEQHIFGTFWADDASYGNDGDWGTVLTIDTSTMHADPACPPDGATGKEYVTMGVSLGNGALEDVAQVIIVGNEVWLNNCCKQAKDLWIKGNVGTDGSLTFPKEQYLKSVEGYDYYFYGAAKEGTKTTPCDLLLTCDAEHDKYFAQQDIIVTADKWEAGQLVIETVQNFILFPSGAAPDMITATPEGEVKVYSRSGQSFIRNMGGVFFGDQNDQDIAICFAPDKKTVYMLYPLSSFDYRYDQEKEELMELWVKGTIEADGKIHYPLYQWLDYEEYYSTGMRTAVFRLFEMPEGSTYELAPEYNEVTFAIDEETGVIRLDSFDGVENAGDYPTLIYGAAYSDNFQWAGYGDAASVYTPKEEEEGIKGQQTTDNRQQTAYDLTGRVLSPRALSVSSRSVFLQSGRKIIK